MFNKDQIKELKAKLDPSHVAKRKQMGFQLSYIEGWHAIVEANRIFGFDNWSRETIEIHCVHETGYQKDGKDMWKVSYTAKVRITVGDIVGRGGADGG